MKHYKYNIVYKTTNLINGRIYYGAHQTDDLDDYYLGSGDLIILAVEKYGEENFERETLFFLGNRKDMYDKEKEIIAEENAVADPNCYNLKEGGEGGFPPGLIWIKNETHSRRIPETDDIPDGWELGRFDSTTKDTIWINNGQESRMIPKDESIPEGWSKGYHFNTNEDKIYITNGFESKMIPKDDPLPDGWRRGNHHKNVAGYIWITNEIDSKRIPETESIPDGWCRGRAKFKSKSSN